MANQSKTIPSLYGLRAISILLVILSHCFLRARSHNLATKLLLALAGNGSVGVSIFFVISGFLITILLLKERSRFGSIDISDFYLRRVFRILPAFLLYIWATACLASAGVLAIPLQQFWHALTFTMDYVPEKNWFLGHVWSLSVEEQFYLIWPLLVVLCSRKVLAFIASAVILLGPFIRMADRLLLPGTRFEIEYMGHTRADMLMFGCLIALYFEHDRLHALLKKSNAFGVPAVSALFLFIISPLLELRFGGIYIKTVGYTLQGLSISLIMLYLVTRPNSISGRVFNSSIAIHIGAISYSLYLWQELFIGFRQFGFVSTFLRIGAAFLLGEASYFFVESPMLRLKRRLSHERPTVPAISEVVSHQVAIDA
jgi:peptidoglycan/LPS O-acetylase OafA/YrhL